MLPANQGQHCIVIDSELHDSKKGQEILRHQKKATNAKHWSGLLLCTGNKAQESSDNTKCAAETPCQTGSSKVTVKVEVTRSSTWMFSVRA